MSVDDTDDDFRAAMGDVEPLSSKRGKVAPSRKPEDGVAQQNRRDAALGLTRQLEDPNPLYLGEVPALDPHELLEWKKDGVQHEVFKKLKVGGYPLDAELDLHGNTVKEARTAVFKLLVNAFAKGHRMLLVAHGRGEKSATPARIKSYVAYWLTEHPHVIAFHSALARQGGTGATYVLIKKSPKSKADNREIYGQQGDVGEESQ